MTKNRNRTMLTALLGGALAVGSLGTAQAAGEKTIDSTVAVKYKEADDSDPYGQSKFKGTVGPKKCAKGRTVTLKGYGTEETNRKGKFSFELDGPAFPGKYKFKVAEEEVKDGVVCAKVKETLTIKEVASHSELQD